MKMDHITVTKQAPEEGWRVQWLKPYDYDNQHGDHFRINWCIIVNVTVCVQ